MASNLKPLDFEDCRVDSPDFREALKEYEAATEHLDKWLKTLTKEAKTASSTTKGTSRRAHSLSACPRSGLSKDSVCPFPSQP